jgi:hypothetical protein
LNLVEARLCGDGLDYQIIRKYVMMGWTGFNWLRIGSCGSYCEDCNELPVSIKVGFL